MKIYPVDKNKEKQQLEKRSAETEKIMRWIALAAAFTGVFVFFVKLLFF